MQTTLDEGASVAEFAGVRVALDDDTSVDVDTTVEVAERVGVAVTLEDVEPCKLLEGWMETAGDVVADIV